MAEAAWSAAALRFSVHNSVDNTVVVQDMVYSICTLGFVFACSCNVCPLLSMDKAALVWGQVSRLLMRVFVQAGQNDTPTCIVGFDP